MLRTSSEVNRLLLYNRDFRVFFSSTIPEIILHITPKIFFNYVKKKKKKKKKKKSYYSVHFMKNSKQ